ncbi:signal peptidase I [Streptomyces albidoflavus]
MGIVVAVLAGLVVLALAATAVLSVRIDGDSMEPTLHDGERVLPLPVQSGEVGRFDVVLMRTPGRDALLVKRVVALPGDQVRIAPGPQQGHQRVLVRRAGAERWYEFTVPGAADAGLVTPCCAADGRRSAAPAARTVPKGSSSSSVTTPTARTTRGPTAGPTWTPSPAGCGCGRGRSRRPGR